MHKPNLNLLSADERALLARLIQQYTTPGVIEAHINAALSGAHTDPVLFLSFHRSYIAGLEAFLSAQGYGQWVPLPAWNPIETIPEEFNIPRTGLGQLQNLNPQVSFFPDFSTDNLVNFGTIEELGAALLQRHNIVHRRIGGIMNSMSRAPEAPIFWPLHSFIDDIWWEWQRITVAVPSCIGLKMDQAKKLLYHCGLGVNIPQKKFHISTWMPPVKKQQPAPFTFTPYGSKVKLFD